MIPFFGLPFEALPPEVQEQMKRQHDMAEMTQDDLHHGLQAFFEGLDEEQGMRLVQMLHTIGHVPEAAMAHYWEGVMVGIRLTKFGLCMYHGVDHTKEMQEALNPETPAEPSPTGPLDFESINDLIEFEPREKITPESFDTEQRGLMQMYHLDDAYDEETKEFLGFVCTGIEGAAGPCGVRYLSLDDRMVREPEQCSGCFVKMGQG